VDHEISETTAPEVAVGQQQPSFMPIADFKGLWASEVQSVDELRDNPRRVAVDLLKLFLANKTPITLWGPVGARKTRSIQSLADLKDENGVPYQVITIQPSTEDPTVIHGMMFTSLDEHSGETVMKRSLPSVVDQIIKYWDDHHGLTILFMDEMTTCLPAQQHALLGLMTHGHYGDKNIQPYISIAMAANPEGTVSTVNELGEQVINRGGHVAWYGDVELFLEEWSSGFNRPQEAPTPGVQWYINELLVQSSKDAFRSKNWLPEELVPYDSMEHTERSVTELGRMIELIDNVFASAKPGVRKFYIIETTRALLGNTWADKMSKITEQESRRYSPEDVIQKVRDLGISMTSIPSDKNVKAVRETIHVMANDELIDHAASIKMIQGLMDIVTKRGFSIDAYVSAWSFATLSQDEGFSMGLHQYVVDLATKVGAKGVQNGALPRGVSVVPAFVSESIKENIRNSVAQAKANNA
jgi:hypothetical protein